MLVRLTDLRSYKSKSVPPKEAAAKQRLRESGKAAPSIHRVGQSELAAGRLQRAPEWPASPM